MRWIKLIDNDGGPVFVNLDEAFSMKRVKLSTSETETIEVTQVTASAGEMEYVVETPEEIQRRERGNN